MTATMNESVYRLIDMVVEEVSLVDRAANNRQFLIVKRNQAMGSKVKKTVDVEMADAPVIAPDDTGAQDAAPMDAYPQEGSTPIESVMGAMEAITGIVEQLDAMGTPAADERVAWLAAQLNSLAEQLLADMNGTATPSADTGGQPSAQGSPTAKGTRGGQSPWASQAVSAELVEMQGSLAKLATALRSLTDTVKQQQQRIGRVEKQSGLPNSSTHAERTFKATAEERGWPLDLNRSLDWEGVDKTVSFHDE